MSLIIVVTLSMTNNDTGITLIQPSSSQQLLYDIHILCVRIAKRQVAIVKSWSCNKCNLMYDLNHHHNK